LAGRSAYDRAVDADLITKSLDIAAERCDDPTPLVYARLFETHPDMEALFVRDRDGSVRGEMLTRVFEMILDVVDRRTYGLQLIQCEVVTHDGYGVPPSIFGTFFDCVADTVRDLNGADWTAATQAAWRELLVDLNWHADNPDQMAPAKVG